MDRETFEKLVRETLNELPEEFQEKLENIYHGVPKTQRGSHYSALPDKISIFTGPILAVSPTQEVVKKRIKQVIRHEIAHHFGFSEEKVQKAEKHQR